MNTFTALKCHLSKDAFKISVFCDNIRLTLAETAFTRRSYLPGHSPQNYCGQQAEEHQTF